MMNLLLFEDDRVANLSPITLGRPAYSILCGSYRLTDWVTALGNACSAVVRPHLRELQSRECGPPESCEKAASGDAPLGLVNARLVPSLANLRAMQHFFESTETGAVGAGDAVALAKVPAADVLGTGPPTIESLTRYFRSERFAALASRQIEVSLFAYPHDVIRHNLETIRGNLEHRLRHGDYRQIADGVFAAEGAQLGQYIVSDTREGPIVLEAGASVGPYCYLSGPVHLGRAARVIEHAAIKDAVSIGHTTKIGGEVEASVIEPYTNKQHHGFLGHSYLGSWINLGAGTCNSDLKNTYGEVKMEYQGHKVATGMQFVGCIMGDYAKTAVNTSIFTGKTIGACSMMYGFVTTNVPSFVNYARSFGQVTELPPEVMIATQQRMFSRRNVTQRPCDKQLIHDMYRLTREGRQLAGEPLML